MTIAPREPLPGPPKGFRPHMPLSVKLAAALIALGLDPQDVEYDHDPPLAMRIYDAAKGDVIPSANDPKHITPRARQDHRGKTSGPRTKARAQGDQTEIARTRRLAADQAEHRRRMLAPEKRNRPASKWPKRKLRSRGFDKRRTP